MVARYPLPPGESPPLWSRVQNQKWPTSRQRGCITPAAWGVRTASERGVESEVAHKWARWLPSILVKTESSVTRFRNLVKKTIFVLLGSQYLVKKEST